LNTRQSLFGSFEAEFLSINKRQKSLSEKERREAEILSENGRKIPVLRRAAFPLIKSPIYKVS